MAQGRRVARVAALIRKEVSELMLTGLRAARVASTATNINDIGASLS